MTWVHPGTKCFEDLRVGDRFVSPSRTVTEADLHTFAGLSGDYHGLHTDEEFARQSQYGGRICHGLLSLTVLTGLIVCRLGLLETTGLAFLGIDGLRYMHPVRPGDTVHAVMEVQSLRLSRRKPDRGIVDFRLQGINHRGELFLEAIWHQLLATRSWLEAQGAAD